MPKTMLAVVKPEAAPGAEIREVKIPAEEDTAAVATVPPTYPGAPEFVQKVTARLLADEGDLMPVSAIPLDGCWPTGTARFEKRRPNRPLIAKPASGSRGMSQSCISSSSNPRRQYSESRGF